MKNQKAKGTKGERELVHYFNESGWSCVRVAGSGSSRWPSPDLLAGNALRQIAIECKVTKEEKKYFLEEEIEQLNAFSRKFGAEAWIGIRFGRLPWYFIMPEDLQNTGKCWTISAERIQTRGLTKEELIQRNI